MPQSSSEQSLVTNIYPVLMGKSDILVKDDFGHTNPLEVGDYTHHHNNRELVNLENASVNIDNSSDVIIGPVTQFNVNGNVTIYQNENGPTSTDGGGDNQDEKTNSYDAKLPQAEKAGEQGYLEVNKRKNLTKIFLWILLALFLLLIGSIVIVIIVDKPEGKNLLSPPHTHTSDIGNHQFFTRNDWGARPPKYRLNVTGPVDMAIIKHTGGRTCNNFKDCAKIVTTLQSLSAQRGNPDIYCNFLIGSDGNIYEGRGWGVQPEYRNDTVDIVFMGTYDIDEPTPFMIHAAEALLEDGVKKKYLSEDYIVVCHNQTTNTLSPGQNICKEVQKWPHYDPTLHFNNQLK